MTHPNAATVIGEGGLRGVLEAPLPKHDSEDAAVPVRLESGERIMVPADLLARQDDGTYRTSLSLSALRAAAERGEQSEAGEHQVIPIVEEQVRVARQEVERGRVRITKRVEQHEETIDEPLLHERVEVERVPVGREIDGPVEVRQEGEVTIIPVFEEVLVVQKRLMLKEELHVRKERQKVQEPQHITLRREHVEVERVEGEAKGKPGPSA